MVTVRNWSTNGGRWFIKASTYLRQKRRIVKITNMNASAPSHIKTAPQPPLALHLPHFHHHILGKLCLALATAKGAARPSFATNQLKRTRTDLLARRSNADDASLAPSLVKAFKGRPHHLKIVKQQAVIERSTRATLVLPMHSKV
jgi:hypothetical protein